MSNSAAEWPYPVLTEGPFAGSCRIQPLEGNAQWAVPVAMRGDEPLSRATLTLRPAEGAPSARWQLPLHELTRPFEGLDRGLARQRDGGVFRAAAAAALREMETPLLVVANAEGVATRPRSLVELSGAVPPGFARSCTRVLVTGRWANHVLQHLLGSNARADTRTLARLANRLPGLPFRGRLVRKARSYAERTEAQSPGFVRASGLHYGAWPLLELYFGLSHTLLQRTHEGRAVHAARACDDPSRPRTLLDELCRKALGAHDLQPGEEVVLAEPVKGLRVVARDRGGLHAALRWRTTFVAGNQKGLERLRGAARYPGVEAVEWTGAR